MMSERRIDPEDGVGVRTSGSETKVDRSHFCEGEEVRAAPGKFCRLRSSRCSFFDFAWRIFGLMCGQRLTFGVGLECAMS